MRVFDAYSDTSKLGKLQVGLSASSSGEHHPSLAPSFLLVSSPLPSAALSSRSADEQLGLISPPD
jgi:hypothetical protein